MKPFLEQFEQWIATKNVEELRKCEFVVAEKLRNWGRLVEEMESDKQSFLWNDNLALAVKSELKKLKFLIKKIDFLE